MSLPLQAVERLFSRLTATYGRDFMARYEGVNEIAVKSSWAHELAGFKEQLQSIAWALENLPTRAPNVLEFRELCRRAPAVAVPQLESPVASPERVAAELAKLGHIRKNRGAEIDRKDWARELMARHERGEVLKPIQLRFYREALRLKKPEAVCVVAK